MGGETPAMNRLTAWGRSAVELLQRLALLPWHSGMATPTMHCLTARGTRALCCLTAWGQWAMQLLQCTAPLPGGSRKCNSCNAVPHCLWAVGSATHAMHCLTARGTRAVCCVNARGHGAVQLLQCIASLLGGSGQCNSCNALPHWAVQPLQCTASLSRGSGQRNCCNALPHCVGAMGSATTVMQCFSALGQWSVQLL